MEEEKNQNGREVQAFRGDNSPSVCKGNRKAIVQSATGAMGDYRTQESAYYSNILVGRSGSRPAPDSLVLCTNGAKDQADEGRLERVAGGGCPACTTAHRRVARRKREETTPGMRKCDWKGESRGKEESTRWGEMGRRVGVEWFRVASLCSDGIKISTKHYQPTNLYRVPLPVGVEICITRVRVIWLDAKLRL